MARFVKSTIMGYKDVPGGWTDSECDSVILSVEEYSQMLGEKKQAENERYQTIRDSGEKVRRIEAKASEELSRIKKELTEAAEGKVNEIKEKLDEANQSIKDLQDALNAQVSLNRNLKRIAKERANQQRSVPGKKEHDGYLVLFSRQWIERYDYTYTQEEYDKLDWEIQRKHKFPYTEHRKASVWKNTIQTPYDASIPLEAVKTMVEDDDLWYGKILHEIGVEAMCKNESNGTYQVFLDEDGKTVNGAYRWEFVANYKYGFWEVEIYTTGSLTVPEERRPKLRQNNKTKPLKKKEKKHLPEEDPNYILPDSEYEKHDGFGLEDSDFFLEGDIEYADDSDLLEQAYNDLK